MNLKGHITKRKFEVNDSKESFILEDCYIEDGLLKVEIKTKDGVTLNLEIKSVEKIELNIDSKDENEKKLQIQKFLNSIGNGTILSINLKEGELTAKINNKKIEALLIE